MIQHLLNLLSPTHNDEGLDGAGDLCRHRRHCVQQNNQVTAVHVAERQLKNCINQNLQRVQHGNNDLKCRYIVAARPKANQFPSDFLSAEKVFSLDEAVCVEHF